MMPIRLLFYTLILIFSQVFIPLCEGSTTKGEETSVGSTKSGGDDGSGATKSTDGASGKPGKDAGGNDTVSWSSIPDDEKSSGGKGKPDGFEVFHNPPTAGGDPNAKKPVNFQKPKGGAPSLTGLGNIQRRFLQAICFLTASRYMFV
ncbi:uncharacterized protein LOC141853558 [Brevipalpus obovatus]|uniref:uncharacterized protein LOC141853558 n=1 Tax=Brevipalpus obovatus TaxID=246614 RepID=UPI003D9F5B91